MVRAFVAKHGGILAIGMGIVALVALLVIVTFQFVKKDDSPANQQDTVVIEGTVVCLPHKNTSGPQTMECAFGIKDKKGKYYGIKDTDSNYKNIQSVPTGKKVRVHGSLGASLDTRYDTVGTIQVTSIDEL